MAVMLSLKLEKKFLKKVDKVVKSGDYSSRTDFIRDALREKLREIERRRFLRLLEEGRGAAKHKVTDADIHEARAEAVKELGKKFGL